MSKMKLDITLIDALRFGAYNEGANIIEFFINLAHIDPYEKVRKMPNYSELIKLGKLIVNGYISDDKNLSESYISKSRFLNMGNGIYCMVHREGENSEVVFSFIRNSDVELLKNVFPKDREGKRELFMNQLTRIQLLINSKFGKYKYSSKFYINSMITSLICYSEHKNKFPIGKNDINFKVYIDDNDSQLVSYI